MDSDPSHDDLRRKSACPENGPIVLFLNNLEGLEDKRGLLDERGGSAHPRAHDCPSPHASSSFEPHTSAAASISSRPPSGDLVRPDSSDTRPEHPGPPESACQYPSDTGQHAHALLGTMSVVFEHRASMFHPDGNYPPIGEAPDLPDVGADVHVVAHNVAVVHDVADIHPEVHPEGHAEAQQDMMHDPKSDPVHDVQAVHDVPEPQDATQPHDVHPDHQMHEAHQVHGVHGIHQSHGDAGDVVHEVHEVHDVVHEMQNAHQVHGVLHDDMQPDESSRFDETDVAELAAAVHGYAAQSSGMVESEPTLQMVHGLPDLPVLAADKPDSPPPQVVNGNHRIKLIPKPERQPTKNLTGKFICTWEGCQEDVREFGRKCEWNKHMDKHDRPYKCLAEGCEKLAGFTYSGGLLRHEREVHAKHGGPKNPLNCPHPTCKRHTGKGFSRQENLNEHLRRCHRNGSPSNAGGDTDDAASEVAAAGGVAMPGSAAKRKRDAADDDLADLRAEVKKTRMENDELRLQLEMQSRQIEDMVQQIRELRQTPDLQQSPEILQ
ncbi:hypothetical protein RB601_004900 [Gaeumannomyces tritici]